MKLAVLLALAALCAHAKPVEESTRGLTGELAGEDETEGEVSLQPLPPPPPPRRARSIAPSEEQEARDAFLALLEELNQIARDGGQGESGREYDYFALFGVFKEPESGRAVVYAEKVPLDLADPDEPEAARVRRQL